MGSTTETISSPSNMTSPASAMDYSDPYFLSSTDHPGLTIVSQVFDGSRYGAWRRSVLIALSVRNKLGFINGSIKTPDEKSAQFENWNRKDIGDSVLYSSTAKELWEELETRYGQSNGTQFFQMQKELSSITQGTDDIAIYFTRIKRIWDELKFLHIFEICGCECKCGAKTKNLKATENQKLIQLLIGLNEAYTFIRGNILMMKPLPTPNEAYSILLHEEKQREVHASIHFSGQTSSFNAAGTKFQNAKWKNRGNVQKGNFENRKGGIFCNYCKKSAHLIETCFKLHGFPPSFKFTKQKRTYGNALGSANASFGIEEGGQGVSSDFEANVTANMAGMIAALYAFSSHLNKLHNNPWILDTGATQHMTYDISLLHDTKELSRPVYVNLPNGYKVKAIGIGKLLIPPNLILINVLYVPSFKHSLISVQQLCTQLDCLLIFSKFGCYIHAPSLKKLQVFGETTDGLYVLDNAAPSSSSSLSNVSVTSTISAEPSLPCSSLQSLLSDVFNVSPFD
uniref:Retrotransposon Copia-like N-terminal domain-containing protein n=1 Tax=Nicotiana tabacum TaxID=4097 RepID=A0A1S4ABT6_TOBAC|nr:PREDICTED: uncharacterized protein LOC107795808 [Nicotiana tabacum]